MQGMLFLREVDGGPITRIINTHLLAMAAASPENSEWTQLICGNANITMHMPLAAFIAELERLITKNYRVSLEQSVQWHEKRMADTEKVMKSALRGLHDQ